jgi:hypothetical protein
MFLVVAQYIQLRPRAEIKQGTRTHPRAYEFFGVHAHVVLRGKARVQTYHVKNLDYITTDQHH